MFQPTRTQDACSFHSSSRSESEPWSPHYKHQKTDGARAGSSDHRSLAPLVLTNCVQGGPTADSLSLKEFLVRRCQKVVNGRQFVEAAAPAYRGVPAFVRCDPFAFKSRGAHESALLGRRSFIRAILLTVACGDGSAPGRE
jgi:hypothetical protein